MQNKWDPILAAAKRLFIDQGYGATSMDEIASQSGATKRTVYNNFGSKERLLEAVAAHSIELFSEKAPALAPDAGPGGVCRLRGADHRNDDLARRGRPPASDRLRKSLVSERSPSG